MFFGLFLAMLAGWVSFRSFSRHHSNVSRSNIELSDGQREAANLLNMAQRELASEWKSTFAAGNGHALYHEGDDYSWRFTQDYFFSSDTPTEAEVQTAVNRLSHLPVMENWNGPNHPEGQEREREIVVCDNGRGQFGVRVALRLARGHHDELKIAWK